MLRPQLHSLLLQCRIIGPQPRATALDLPGDAVDLGAYGCIRARPPGRAQPLQLRSVGLKQRRLPLDPGTTPLELSPLGLMTGIP